MEETAGLDGCSDGCACSFAGPEPRQPELFSVLACVPRALSPPPPALSGTFSGPNSLLSSRLKCLPLSSPPGCLPGASNSLRVFSRSLSPPSPSGTGFRMPALEFRASFEPPPSLPPSLLHAPGARFRICSCRVRPVADPGEVVSSYSRTPHDPLRWSLRNFQFPQHGFLNHSSRCQSQEENVHWVARAKCDPFLWVTARLSGLAF